MKKKKSEPIEPTEPRAEIYLGTRPYSSLSGAEKLALFAAVRAMLGVMWEQRAKIDPKYAELPDDYLVALGIPRPEPPDRPE